MRRSAPENFDFGCGDTTYVRTAGRIDLYSKTALNWFGPGSKKGLDLYDVAINTGRDGVPSYSGTVDPITGLVRPDVLWVEDKYIALTPYVQDAHTLIEDWTAGIDVGWPDGGTWEESVPEYKPVTTRLVQWNGDTDTKFNRKSVFEHGHNSSFAIRLELAPESQDGDPTLGTRFVAISWGDLKWSMFFPFGDTPVLAENVGGQWVPRQKLPSLPSGRGNGLTGEALIIVEHIRNSVVVTVAYAPDVIIPNSAIGDQINTDDTLERAFYSRDDFDGLPPIEWNSGKFHVWGLGGQFSFGLNVVQYASSAYWLSAIAPLTEGPRGTIIGGDLPTFYIRGNANGGTLTTQAVNTYLDPFIRYRVNFVPHTHTIGSRTWYRTPDFEAMEVWYPAITTPGYSDPGDLGSQFSGRILKATVTKPESIDQMSASAELFFPDGFNSVTGNWRWRPMRMFLGIDGGDPGQFYLTNAFTGFITEFGTRQSEDGPYTIVDMEFTTGIIRARKSKFGKDTAPRGGKTLNQALVLWFASLGIPPTDYILHPRGDIIVLPTGRAEDPAFKPPPLSDAWGWHSKLCEIFGLALTWTDDGYIRVVDQEVTIMSPAFWVADPVVVHPDHNLPDIQLRESTLDTYTRFILHSRIPRRKDGFGRSIGENLDLVYTAWAINQQAEQNPNYFAHRPFLEEFEDNLDFGPVAIGFINLAVYYKAAEYIMPRMEAEFEGELALNLGRRYLIRILGGKNQEHGIYRIETMKHEVDAERMHGSTTIKASRMV